MMPLSARQTEQLLTPIHPDRVLFKRGLAYLEAGNRFYNYITSSGAWQTGNAYGSTRAIEGTLVWIHAVITEDNLTGTYGFGLGRHTTLPAYSPWAGPMRSCVWDKALTAEQRTLAIRAMAAGLTRP